MPKLYEYLGIVLYFWSDEHEPIHVHGRHGTSEIKAEIVFEEGKIVSINFKNVAGKKRFDKTKRRDFEDFVNKYAEQIVAKWVDYFVYKKDIKSESITRRIK